MPNRRRVFEFLLTWIPLTGLLGALLVTAERLTLSDVAAQVPLLALFFTFILQSSLYAVRALPVQRHTFVRVVSVHVVSAAVAIWGIVALLVGTLVSAAGAPIKPINTWSELTVVFTVGGSAYLWTVTYHYLTLAAHKSRQAEERARESRSLALNAELKALRAQLNPHFLFNSLNSIAALTTIDPRQARRMCIFLADFLRRSLSLGNQKTIRLSDELDLVHAYLAVEGIRFQDKMSIRETISPDVEKIAVPPLLLQPLVENAVKHGIAGMDTPGWISIDAGVVSDAVVVTVTNPMDPEAAASAGGGHGLRIVRQRLENHYGQTAALDIARTDISGPAFRARLTLPFDTEEISP